MEYVRRVTRKEGTNHRREGTQQDDCMICDTGEVVESSQMIVGSQEMLRLMKGDGRRKLWRIKMLCSLGKRAGNDSKHQPFMLFTLDAGSRVLSSANISVAGSLEGHMISAFILSCFQKLS